MCMHVHIRMRIDMCTGMYTDVFVKICITDLYTNAHEHSDKCPWLCAGGTGSAQIVHDRTKARPVTCRHGKRHQHRVQTYIQASKDVWIDTCCRGAATESCSSANSWNPQDSCTCIDICVNEYRNLHRPCIDMCKGAYADMFHRPVHHREYRYYYVV